MKGLKVSNFDPNRGVLVGSGISSGTTASGSIGSVTDGTTTVTDVSSLVFPSSVVTQLADGVAQVDNTGTTGFLTTTDGEGHAVDTNTASGAAATIDCSLANIFDITLTADCTLTITNPPASGVGGIIQIILRQGGSGSYTVTWPAAVDWPDTDGTTGGSAPTLWTAVGAQDDIELSTLDGGVTWGGTFLSHGASAFTGFATPAIVLGTAAAAGAATTGIRSDSTIVAFDATSPANVAAVGVASSTGSVAKAARRDHGHALTYHDEPLTDGASNFIFDGGDIVVVTGVPN